MTCHHKVMHEHSWQEYTTIFGDLIPEAVSCRICGVVHEFDNPQVEYEPPLAYFYANLAGVRLERIFAISGG